MKRAIVLLGTIFGLALIFYASLFAFAELWTEIVVLRTFDDDGAPHETRVMVIDIADRPWIRGRPYRGWFRRVEANPDVEIYRGERWYPMRASISRQSSDAAEFEKVVVERYGLAYRFFDVIARMSSNEIPVRLEPRSP